MNPIMEALRWWLTKEANMEIAILDRNIARGEEFLLHPYTPEEVKETREVVLTWLDRKSETVTIRDNMWKGTDGDN